VEIHLSARKHGVADDDIRHAVEQPLARDELDAYRVLWLGPDRAGNLLEIVVLYLDRRAIAIHAMKMRPKYAHLLP
jgi:hypothetical protein